MTTSGVASSATTVDDDLVLALLGPKAAGGPRRSVKQLLQSGRRQLQILIEQLPEEDRLSAEVASGHLRADGVRVLLCDDPRYPDRLRRFPGAPFALFYQGPIELLERTAIGICGSRNAGARGLQAARACGRDAALLDMVVVSGYAKGIDTESHLAALEAGGGTVAVLAEGISRFRFKQSYLKLPESARARMLVVSQFPPEQGWTPGAAMTRNSVIIGLGHALVVVEAGETGGTIRAGETALRADHPLLVLDFANENPPGNQQLLDSGARAVPDRAQLNAELRRLSAGQGGQLAFE